MVQASEVSETSDFRESVLHAEIEGSDHAALLGAVISLMTLTAKARREDAAARMRVLGAVAERPMLGRDVALDLGIDASTVSRHLASLEADGLIERAANEGDRRASPVIATAQGRDIYVASLRSRLTVITNAVADWPAADREQLAVLLDRLVTAIATAKDEEAQGRS
jgi:DNA-binding MarR family transcriptional regulator